ncbi:hypothetical protein MTR67_043836 [Solanum verrucosum]|uniref:Uncharacterized protein n=1 Tax=Solanum verrucosum TaxID=315347 RepID=A0AAF0US66_SOLVR|nr:hypothetical protein MTR67_043836 [Solanum verrucosum]
MILAEPSNGRVIVIGARLAGFAAARKLTSFGFEVTFLEGRKHIGTLGNPPGLLALQLSYTLHKVRDQYPLYRADGKPVDEYLDYKKKLQSVILVVGGILSSHRRSCTQV